MNELFSRIRPSWNCEAMLIRGKLTDRKIEEYMRRGFYDPEYRAARKKLMDQKSFVRNMKRISKGNFMEAEDGRLIYSPM
jgi:hypothetical protein